MKQPCCSGDANSLREVEKVIAPHVLCGENIRNANSCAISADHPSDPDIDRSSVMANHPDPSQQPEHPDDTHQKASTPPSETSMGGAADVPGKAPMISDSFI